MKILIIGSQPQGPEGGQLPPRDDFRSFCRQLGAVFAEKKHELLIMSDADDTADYYVTIGSDSAGGNVTAVWPKDKPTPAPRIPDLKREISCIQSESGLSSGRLYQVSLADVVVMIGGNKKTLEIIPLCLAMQKPFLPIPQFDGAAREIFGRLRTILEAGHADLLEGLVALGRHRITSSSKTEELRDICNEITTYTEKIKKNNPIFGESTKVELKYWREW